MNISLTNWTAWPRVRAGGRGPGEVIERASRGRADDPSVAQGDPGERPPPFFFFERV